MGHRRLSMGQALPFVGLAAAARRDTAVSEHSDIHHMRRNPHMRNAASPDDAGTGSGNGMQGNAEMILLRLLPILRTRHSLRLMGHVAQGFDTLGAVILVVGFVWSFLLAVAW